MATNKLTINFFGCENAPANGYQVFYRPRFSTGAYRHAGPFTSSPIVIVDTNNDATNQKYEGYIQADCGDGNFGTAVPFFPDGYRCGDSVAGDYAGNDVHNYGDYALNTITNTPAVMHINWNAYDRPNRFVVKNLTDNTIAVDSGWKGYAPYAGPWGANISTPISGIVSFAVIAGKQYALQVDGGNANPLSPLSDHWDVLLTCD